MMSQKSKSLLVLFTMAIIAFGCSETNNPSKVAESEIQPAPSHHEQLKELDWLVGNWIDQDQNDDIVINLTYKWDKNKNFLIQHFTSKVLNQEEIEGQQILGWDPSLEKIRGWIFDSDGGFGESIWAQQNDKWISRVNFTLSDGRKASAIHVYSKINPDTYTFVSESRDIDGEMLPNIGPFKIIKQ